MSPDEIPELEAQLQTQPNNGRVVLRYAAALFAAGRCDTAMAVARRGMSLRPSDALGPLVLGQCYEAQENLDQAINVYDRFAEANPDAPGTAAVETRSLLARRARATATARAALANEQNLTPMPPNSGAVAVLPITIVGDSSYQPLGRGLAQMLISDLSLLQRFALVERLQLNALLDEIEFNQGDRVDPSTAARVGLLARAGRMVSGLAAIPEDGDVRFEATVVLSTGEVTTPSSSTGSLRDLLRLEKQVVVDISSQLGYTLSRAEREAILENGTTDLVAFLAYSNGLIAEDAGDYGSAAVYYQRAVQSDPNFSQARTGYRQAASAPQVSQATAAQVTTVAAQQVETPVATGDVADSRSGEVNSGLLDLAGNSSENNQRGDAQIAGSGGTGGEPTTQAARLPSADPPNTPTNEGTTPNVTGTIRIVFKIP